jgi:hypothetical protein
MAINLDRLADDFGNVLEILKKAVIVEVVRRSYESGSTPDFDSFEYATANPPNARTMYLLDCLLGGRVPYVHKNYIKECPELKEVMALAVGLNVFALWKTGESFSANQLKENAEYAGILEKNVQPDFTNLKAVLQKALNLDTETNKKLAVLKKALPVLMNKVESEFSHIRQPRYEGVKSCLVPFVTILSFLGALSSAAIIVMYRLMA